MTKPHAKPRTLLKTAAAAVAMIATTIVGGASSPVEASKS